MDNETLALHIEFNALFDELAKLHPDDTRLVVEREQHAEFDLISVRTGDAKNTAWSDSDGKRIDGDITTGFTRQRRGVREVV